MSGLITVPSIGPRDENDVRTSKLSVAPTVMPGHGPWRADGIETRTRISRRNAHTDTGIHRVIYRLKARPWRLGTAQTQVSDVNMVGWVAIAIGIYGFFKGSYYVAVIAFAQGITCFVSIQCDLWRDTFDV